MSNLQDTRIYRAMTVAEADALFLRIARQKAQIDAAAAAYKKKIAEMEIAFKSSFDQLAAEYAMMTDELCSYIMSNPERFVKPRKRPVGQIGTYGITTDPAFVVINDKASVVNYAVENSSDDMFRVERIPDKDAVFRHIAGGETVPGARLIPAGDVAKIAFKKNYAELLTSEAAG